MSDISEKAIKLIKDLRRDISIDIMFTPEKNAEDESLKALVDYIAELEAENDRLQSGWFRDETICPDGSLRPKVSDLLNRIAELEAEVTKHHELQDSYCDRIAELKAERKWIPVSERLPDGGHREFYEVACIYQDFGELALFSKGRWVIYEGENVYDVTKRVKFWRKRQYLPDEVIAVLSKGEMNPEVQE